ncbi:MAG: hypothetical protein K0S32_3925 [Bacteroidetes bacterium]|jgi:O-antigen/teichoic acid export membrane protein|nr:hypothetical protein [Bacteroidota bacterium]
MNRIFSNKNLSVATDVVVNAGRGLGTMAFSAVVFLILSQLPDKTVLYEYSWLTMIVNLMLAFIGWGLKDRVMQEYVNNISTIRNSFSVFFSLRLFLTVICLFVVPFMNFGTELKIILILIIIFRMLTSLTDPLLMIYKKNKLVFIFEVIIFTVAIALMWFNSEFTRKAMLVLLIVEATRTLVSLSALISTKSLSFGWTQPFQLMGETKFYFLIALLSFCMSRADAYVLGLFKKDIVFPHYTIVLNLIGASQIAISSIYGNSLKGVFKMDITKARQTLDRLFPQFILVSLLFPALIFLTVNYIYRISIPLEVYGCVVINIFFYCLTMRQLYILNHSNRMNLFLAGSIISSIANILTSILLVPVLSITGAMVANTIGVIILVTSIAVLLKRNIIKV